MKILYFTLIQELSSSVACHWLRPDDQGIQRASEIVLISTNLVTQIKRNVYARFKDIQINMVNKWLSTTTASQRKFKLLRCFLIEEEFYKMIPWLWKSYHLFFKIINLSNWLASCKDSIWKQYYNKLAFMR